MVQPVIEARGLGIKFVKQRRRKLRLRELVIHLGRKAPSKDEFWALRDVSFQIRPGEAVGVIGRNGSGKSTLLRLIAGVMAPDEGGVTCHQQVAPLLQVGAGFSGDLTGRENVQLVGALYGLDPAHLKRKLPQIIEFAEIGDFIDMPVRHYSSGMKVRLGFAITAQLHHPVLLVDEALAVGDKEFRAKCYREMERMRSEGRTLVLVSHRESDLTRFCTRGLFLEKGRLVVDGTLDEALGTYQQGARA
ncbi:MAG TPA: ABC transporter ATP-binding protein [Micromonosporaceae bacterium]|nr:ABC transporter ATP-binding protein [Micromonosporaceae bacterium]